MECGKDCASCGGCVGCGALYMTEGELSMLEQFAQIPFKPLGSKPGSEEPFHLTAEGPADPKVLQMLKLKGLITLDYGLPLEGCDYAGYAGMEQGSMALTRRGQLAVEALEVQGVTEE